MGGRIAALGIAAFATIACWEPIGPPVVGGPQAGLRPTGHRVAGAGHVAQAAGLREFTFHAIEIDGGTARGSFKVVLPNGLFFEADVTCLSVDANTGWVGGIIRATNAAVVVLGSVSTFYAIDNGEGALAADVVSTAAFNGAAGADAAFCANQPLALPPLAVTGGNVQVR